MDWNKVLALYMGSFYLPDQTSLGFAQKVDIKLKKLMDFNLLAHC
jgi:hypothetical protein